MLTKVDLNDTDLTVSRLCYGTNMLGWMLDQGKSNAILDTFADLGGNFIDTARSYGDWMPDAPIGASERAVGAWLKTQKRENCVIATKGGFFDMRVGDYRNRVTPEDVTADLAQSLDHLGVDSIDLYFLHMDNPESPVEPIIDALIAHREAGRIRHFAASNWAADRIAAANAYAASLGKQGFVASETFWGLAVPDAGAAAQQGYVHYYEGEYEDLHAAGLPVVAYAAQSGGYFTKLATGSVGEQLAARYANPANTRRLAVVQSLAAKYGVSINEIALSYLLSQPSQTIAIFGGSSPEQVAHSAKADALTLTAEDLSALRNA
ncbi:aldo/keto reductase [Novosphingobium sp. SL115]|uniref:aldo/keto reductase n=1 Tax=Novosphingobium sp. SL115 TaxID=2995150 RepID=UPI00227455FA|nr:aldo/keto reductase [Novosphingobium sp. SL115]MCY1672869.1 aldo/keto reductase [Novosphingobium sp. SL115]